MFNIQMETRKLPLWFATLLPIVISILGMALGVSFIFLSGLNKTTYRNLIVNVYFLTGVVVLARLFRLSAEDLGLKVIKGRVQIHVILSLVTLTLYILFYIFVIRISTIKPFSSSTLWGLMTYLIVVIAEDVYFRGALYSVFEKRFSAKIALIITSLLFGLFHAQQGVRSIILKIFTGWLWGSIRYSTGMIFLVIIPVHFAYNSIWLQFEGNWSNPPAWALYAFPALEFVHGLVIVILRDGKLWNILTISG